MADTILEIFAHDLFSWIYQTYLAAREMSIEVPSEFKASNYCTDDFKRVLNLFRKVFHDRFQSILKSTLPSSSLHAEAFVSHMKCSCKELYDTKSPEFSFLVVCTFLFEVVLFFFQKECFCLVNDMHEILVHVLNGTKLSEPDADEAWTSLLLSMPIMKDANFLRDTHHSYVNQWSRSYFVVEELQPHSSQPAVLEIQVADVQGTASGSQAANESISALEEPVSQEALLERKLALKRKFVRIRPFVYSDEPLEQCKLCGTKCFDHMKAFFQPAIKYKEQILL